MTQTFLNLKSFSNGDHLSLEEHKMLPYRITQVGKENALFITDLELRAWMEDTLNEWEEDAEDYQEEIEDLVSGLMDGDFIKDQIIEFLDSGNYSTCDLEHFREYRRMCDEYDQDAVDAFCEDFYIDSIEHFEEAYQGIYDSGADFAEQLVDDCYGMRDFPTWVQIDWEASWDHALSYDYSITEDGYVFCNNF